MKSLITAVLFATSIFAQNNLTAVGSPSFGSTSCKFSSCVTTSTGNVLTAGGSAATTFNGNNWTLDFWLKASVTGGTKAYFSTDVTGGRPYAFWIGEVSSVILVSIQMGPSFPSDINFSTSVAPSGAWQHIAVSMSGGTNLEIYVDGTRTNNKTGTYTSPLASQIGFGRLIPAGSANDAAAVFDEALIRNVDVFSGASFTVPTAEYANSVADGISLYHFTNTNDSVGAGASLTTGTLSSSLLSATSVTLSLATITGGTPTYTSTLQRSTFSGSCATFSNILTTATGATPSWTDTGLTPSTSYCYRVNTVDTASGSVTSNTITITTSAATLYTRYDGAGPKAGQAVMALVPGLASAIPYNPGVPTNVIIYVHGAGETQEAWLTDSLKAGFITPFINAGWILAGTNARNDNWGNQLSTDDYADLYRYLTNNFNIGKVAILGQSMGGLNSANLISQGKIPNIHAYACIYCVFSLQNLHSLGSYTSAINTAHGVTGTGTATYANMTFGLDPLLVAPTYATNYRFLGMRFYASPGDTIVPTPQNTDAFIAITAPFAVESFKYTATGNHGDPSHFQPSDLLAFFQRRFAAGPFVLSGGVQ
jgi:pimeloyl-ACP methyl ester carboxylesterase